jgi:hypothetical protein
VLQRGPCLPQIEYPIGQDLRLTIVTTASDVNTGGAGATPGSDSDEPKADTERRLDTIRDIFDALRACWVPPRIMAHHTTAREAGMVFARTRPKLAAYTHLVFLASRQVPSATVADLIAETRQTYSGPLEVGEDLMCFEIGETASVRQPTELKHEWESGVIRPVRGGFPARIGLFAAHHYGSNQRDTPHGRPMLTALIITHPFQIPSVALTSALSRAYQFRARMNGEDGHMRVGSIVVALVAALALTGCSDNVTPIKGEKGDPGQKGDPGPAGPPGQPGPPGAPAAAFRFVEGECRQPCIVACEDNERILNTYAIDPGGTFTFEADNKATFRPRRQGVAAKVILACIARWAAQPREASQPREKGKLDVLCIGSKVEFGDRTA